MHVEQVKCSRAVPCCGWFQLAIIFTAQVASHVPCTTEDAEPYSLSVSASERGPPFLGSLHAVQSLHTGRTLLWSRTFAQDGFALRLDVNMSDAVRVTAPSSPAAPPAKPCEAATLAVQGCHALQEPVIDQTSPMSLDAPPAGFSDPVLSSPCMGSENPAQATCTASHAFLSQHVSAACPSPFPRTTPHSPQPASLDSASRPSCVSWVPCADSGLHCWPLIVLGAANVVQLLVLVRMMRSGKTGPASADVPAVPLPAEAPLKTIENRRTPGAALPPHPEPSSTSHASQPAAASRSIANSKAVTSSVHRAAQRAQQAANPGDNGFVAHRSAPQPSHARWAGGETLEHGASLPSSSWRREDPADANKWQRDGWGRLKRQLSFKGEAPSSTNAASEE